MTPPYFILPDLLAEVEVPDSGTHSKTIYEDSTLKAVLFGFAAGEELSEHSSSRAATLHVLSGQVALGLENDRYEVGPGAWAHMLPDVAHSIRAETETVLLLLLYS